MGAVDVPPGYRVCDACKAAAFRPNGTQRYCRPCSEKRALKRKATWAREHPQPYDPVAARAEREERDGRRRDAGAAISDRADIGWFASADDPDLEWLVRVSVPFSYAMSKNAIWRSVGAGHVVLRKEANDLRVNLGAHVLDALGDRQVRNYRVWLDIMVEKPDQRGDAINVIDLVADAVKDVIGVDDRWYSIRRLDWRIVKRDPRLYVGIGQEVGAVDSQACSYCGRLLPLEEFGRNRAMKSGRARTCTTCSAAARRTAREARAAT